MCSASLFKLRSVFFMSLFLLGHRANIIVGNAFVICVQYSAPRVLWSKHDLHMFISWVRPLRWMSVVSFVASSPCKVTLIMKVSQRGIRSCRIAKTNSLTSWFSQWYITIEAGPLNLMNRSALKAFIYVRLCQILRWTAESFSQGFWLVFSTLIWPGSLSMQSSNVFKSQI